MNEDEAVQTSDLVLSPPPEDESQPGLGDAAPPMVVIPADELFDFFYDYFNPEDPDPEESEELEELPSDEQEEPIESVDAAADLPVTDVDPVLGVVDYLVDMLSGLDKIDGQMSTVAEMLDHPALTTPFEDYTVTEALLLFLLLAAFVSACARMLRGGFSWLRS